VGDIHMAKNITHWWTRLNMDVGFIVYLRDQWLPSIWAIGNYNLVL